MHLVGFIMRIYHDAQSPEGQIKRREIGKKLHSCAEVLSSLRPLVSDKGLIFMTTEE